MIVVKSKIKPANECICDDCGAELVYDNNDTYFGMFGEEGIDCPVCGNFVFIDSDKPRIPPKFPDTFYHTDANDSLCKLSDEEIQTYVDKVMKHEKELKPGEFTCSGTGDTMVYLFKYENETEIVVSKNEWSDTISH